MTFVPHGRDRVLCFSLDCAAASVERQWVGDVGNILSPAVAALGAKGSWDDVSVSPALLSPVFLSPVFHTPLIQAVRARGENV